MRTCLAIGCALLLAACGGGATTPPCNSCDAGGPDLDGGTVPPPDAGSDGGDPIVLPDGGTGHRDGGSDGGAYDGGTHDGGTTWTPRHSPILDENQLAGDRGLKP